MEVVRVEWALPNVVLLLFMMRQPVYFTCWAEWDLKMYQNLCVRSTVLNILFIIVKQGI
jgi:hypothetical protein